MNLRQAAEMALEDICGAKLCEINSMSSRAEMLRLMDKSAEALRQALAQPEQEPVAWMVYTLDGQSVCVTDNPADFTDKHRALPLWPGPFEREWVGLTDDEQDTIARMANDSLDAICLTEAKLEEKNGG